MNVGMIDGDVLSFLTLLRANPFARNQVTDLTFRAHNVSHKELKNVENNGWDSDFVKVRVRGIFPSTSFKQFISTTDVDAALGKHLDPSKYEFALKIIICDPTWEGDDELVIAMRQGLYFTRDDLQSVVADFALQLDRGGSG